MIVVKTFVKTIQITAQEKREEQKDNGSPENKIRFLHYNNNIGLCKNTLIPIKHYLVSVHNINNINFSYLAPLLKLRRHADGTYLCCSLSPLTSVRGYKYFVAMRLYGQTLFSGNYVLQANFLAGKYLIVFMYTKAD